jgi:hypothetical protein
MSILLIERSVATTESLKIQIERTIGWRVTHVQSFPEGLQNLAASKDKVRIAVFTLEGDGCRAFGFIKALTKLGVIGKIERPFILALSHTSQPPDVADRFEKLGTHLLLRKCPEQIVETIKKLQWQARKTNGLPTIMMQRRGGYITTVRANYRAVTEDLGVGPRLCALAGYLVVHSRTEHSTEMLADVLGISKASLKEYFHRLRVAFDRIRHKLGIAMRGRDVFWTRRKPGGHVHGLKANPEIEDTEDFYDNDRNGYESAAAAPMCRGCRERHPRSMTTWSHLGWLCRDCCEELKNVGELS